MAEHVAHLFHGALDRHGLGPEDAALAIGGPTDSWVAAGQALRRVKRSAGAATGLPAARWHDARRPGVADLLHDLRDTPELDAFVSEQLGPLLDDPAPRTRALLETLEAYLAAGGRKAEAARALHLERQSLYLRLRRIEDAAGRLARRPGRRARPASRAARVALPARLDGPSALKRVNATLRPLKRSGGEGEHG